MNILTLSKKIGRNDFRLIGRDSFLQMMLGFVVLIAIFARFALPGLNGYFEANGIMPGSFLDQPLSAYYPLLIGYLIVFQGALLSGAIYGFLLLDEKEDNTLVAMQVTPVRTADYLATRMYIPTLFGWLVVVVQLQFSGLSGLDLGTTLVLAIGSSLIAPIATMTYAILAENKLQGFAIAKFVGVAGWVILIGWFVPEPFQWLLGLFPPFLVTKAYWMALNGDGNWLTVLGVAIVLQLALIWAMVNIFQRKISI